MTSQEALLGSSVHDAAQRAADLLAVLLPPAGPQNHRLSPGPGQQDGEEVGRPLRGVVHAAPEHRLLTGHESIV